jgi:5'-nucleotidase
MTEAARPLILCSNDDGIHARGLVAVAEALATFAEVVVVAPETEQSAMSHSLTLHRPLRLRRVADARWAVDGTPADCVYLALHLEEREGVPKILSRRPDLVVSGVNRGINLGQDVFYSGTVAAAREGALRGVPAIAASCDVAKDAQGNVAYEPEHTAQLVASLARALLALPAAASTAKASDERATPLLLNLNVPVGPVKGVRATKLGTRLWTEWVEQRVDPRGRSYYWIGGSGVSHEQRAGTDTEAHDAGLASLSVLQLDLARHDAPASTAIADILAAIG